MTEADEKELEWWRHLATKIDGLPKVGSAILGRRYRLLEARRMNDNRVAMAWTKRVLHVQDDFVGEFTFQSEPFQAHLIEFSREPDEPDDVPTVLTMPHDDWVDMGRPDAITVTIDPGDRLNE